MSYRRGGPVASGRTIALAPGEEIVRPRCAHRQAEPVVLSTGETVACVCISCLEPLSRNWIWSQRESAERIARCTHDALIDITEFGKAEPDLICATCGAMNP